MMEITDRGFALIETVVAAVIVALAFVGFMEVISSHTRSISSSAEQTGMMHAAEQAMLYGKEKAAATDSGQWNERLSGYNAAITISPVKSEHDSIITMRLREIDVVITSPSSKQSVRTTTYQLVESK